MSTSPKKVAFLYDIDGTLVPPYMQQYGLLPALGISQGEFFEQVNTMVAKYHANEIMVYMNLLAEIAREKNITLTRGFLRECGHSVPFYKGVEEWFKRFNSLADEAGVELFHYAISSGNAEIIEGMRIAPYFHGIHASRFAFDGNDDNAPLVDWMPIAHVVDHTAKTQEVFKISKGLPQYDAKGVNAYMPERKRPFARSRMMVFADGETDIPMLRVVQQGKGGSVAIYDPTSHKSRQTCLQLLTDRRVQAIAPTDFSEHSNVDILARGFLQRFE